MTALKEVQQLKDHRLKVQKSNVSLSNRLLSTWDSLLIHPSANHITKETFNVCWYNLIQAGSLGGDDINELQEIQEFDGCFNVVVQEKECSARLMLLLHNRYRAITVNSSTTPAADGSTHCYPPQIRYHQSNWDIKSKLY